MKYTSMNYEDFYEIAEYLNEHWKGGFSEKEIARNAYDYFEEFNASIEQGYYTYTMQEILDMLNEDMENEYTPDEDRLQIDHWLTLLATGMEKISTKIAERIMALDCFDSYDYIDNGSEDIERLIEEKPFDVIEWLLDCVEVYEMEEDV